MKGKTMRNRRGDMNKSEVTVNSTMQRKAKEMGFEPRAVSPMTTLTPLVGSRSTNANARSTIQPQSPFTSNDTSQSVGETMKFATASNFTISGKAPRFLPPNSTDVVLTVAEATAERQAVAAAALEYGKAIDFQGKTAVSKVEALTVRAKSLEAKVAAKEAELADLRMKRERERLKLQGKDEQDEQHGCQGGGGHHAPIGVESSMGAGEGVGQDSWQEDSAAAAAAGGGNLDRRYSSQSTGDDRNETLKLMNKVGAVPAILLTEGGVIGGSTGMGFVKTPRAGLAPSSLDLDQASRSNTAKKRRSRKRPPTAAERDRVENLKVELAVGERVKGVADSVDNLWGTFDTATNLDEVKEKSVVMLQRMVRKQRVLRKYKRMCSALTSWKLTHGKELLTVCYREVARQKKLAMYVTQMRIKRETKLVQLCVRKWEDEMRSVQLLRQGMKVALKEMEKRTGHLLCRRVLRCWLGVCVGPSSRKACKARFFARRAQARATLHAKVQQRQQQHWQERSGANLAISLHMSTHHPKRQDHHSRLIDRQYDSQLSPSPHNAQSKMGMSKHDSVHELERSGKMPLLLGAHHGPSLLVSVGRGSNESVDSLVVVGDHVAAQQKQQQSHTSKYLSPNPYRRQRARDRLGDGELDDEEADSLEHSDDDGAQQEFTAGSPVENSGEEARLKASNARVKTKRHFEQRVKEAEDKGYVLLKADVEREVTRNLFQELLLRRRYHCVRQHLASLRRYVAQVRQSERLSKSHYREALLRRCFFPWTEWCWTHSKNLHRKLWPAPRQYEVLYDRKAAEKWAKGRFLRWVVPAWRKVARRYGTARAMEKEKVQRFAALNLQAWRGQTLKQRRLRSDAVEKWKAKGRRLIELPFKAWFIFVDEALRERRDVNHLVQHHLRIRTRQLLWKILRTWRHQAVFGRVECLYSRTELMRSLAEHKAKAKKLETAGKSYNHAMEESRRLLEEEHLLVKALGSQLEGRELEVVQLQMELHHCSQDVVRMRAIVDSIGQLAPEAVEERLVELRAVEKQSKDRFDAFEHTTHSSGDDEDSDDADYPDSDDGDGGGGGGDDDGGSDDGPQKQMLQGSGESNSEGGSGDVVDLPQAFVKKPSKKRHPVRSTKKSKTAVAEDWLDLYGDDLRETRIALMLAQSSRAAAEASGNQLLDPNKKSGASPAAATGPGGLDQRQRALESLSWQQQELLRLGNKHEEALLSTANLHATAAADSAEQKLPVGQAALATAALMGATHPTLSEGAEAMGVDAAGQPLKAVLALLEEEERVREVARIAAAAAATANWKGAMGKVAAGVGVLGSNKTGIEGESSESSGLGLQKLSLGLARKRGNKSPGPGGSNGANGDGPAGGAAGLRKSSSFMSDVLSSDGSSTGRGSLRGSVVANARRQGRNSKRNSRRTSSFNSAMRSRTQKVVVKEVAAEMSEQERSTLARTEFMLSRLNFSDTAQFGKEGFAPLQQQKDEAAAAAATGETETTAAVVRKTAARVVGGDDKKRKEVEEAALAAGEAARQGALAAAKQAAAQAEAAGGSAASTGIVVADPEEAARVAEESVYRAAEAEAKVYEAGQLLEKHPLFKEYTLGAADPYEAFVENEETLEREAARNPALRAARDAEEKARREQEDRMVEEKRLQAEREAVAQQLAKVHKQQVRGPGGSLVVLAEGETDGAQLLSANGATGGGGSFDESEEDNLPPMLQKHASHKRPGDDGSGSFGGEDGSVSGGSGRMHLGSGSSSFAMLGGGHGGPTPVTEALLKHVEVNETSRLDLLNLHGVLEFVRTGDVEALPLALQKEWRRTEGDKLSGYAGRNLNQLHPPLSMACDGAKAWPDFVTTMNLKLPPHRRTQMANGAGAVEGPGADQSAAVRPGVAASEARRNATAAMQTQEKFDRVATEGEEGGARRVQSPQRLVSDSRLSSEVSGSVGCYDVDKLGARVFSVDPFQFARHSPADRHPPFLKHDDGDGKKEEEEDGAFPNTTTAATTTAEGGEDDVEELMRRTRAFVAQHSRKEDHHEEHSEMGDHRRHEGGGGTGYGGGAGYGRLQAPSVPSSPSGSLSNEDRVPLPRPDLPGTLREAPLKGAPPTRLSFGYPGNKHPTSSLTHAVVDAAYRPAQEAPTFDVAAASKAASARASSEGRRERQAARRAAADARRNLEDGFGDAANGGGSGKPFDAALLDASASSLPKARWGGAGGGGGGVGGSLRSSNIISDLSADANDADSTAALTAAAAAALTAEPTSAGGGKRRSSWFGLGAVSAPSSRRASLVGGEGESPDTTSSGGSGSQRPSALWAPEGANFGASGWDSFQAGDDDEIDENDDKGGAGSEDMERKQEAVAVLVTAASLEHLSELSEGLMYVPPDDDEQG